MAAGSALRSTRPPTAATSRPTTDWIEAEFVGPYADVILMLNLADEPIGGDYSAPAEAVFRQQHGFGFDEVGDDPRRQRLLGEFQSRYVVEYAVYSAGLWQEIQPGLPVTMSFDGAQARQTLTMPDGGGAVPRYAGQLCGDL